MSDPHATERTPLLSHSSQQNIAQYDINYSNEPITHVIPNQSGTPTYISTQQQSKQCCSGRENCSLACQSTSASSSNCCRSGNNSSFTVNVPNDQNECCGLGLGCSIKGDVKTCCRASSSKAEIERNESCDGLSSQPWQNKAVALLCALLLAGMDDGFFLLGK